MRRSVFLCLLFVLTIAPAWTNQSETVEQGALLRLRCAVVMPDLDVRPVPKFVFEVVSAETGKTVAKITTGFEGSGELTLVPGSYRIRSMMPLELGSRTIEWDVAVELTEARPHDVELSNDNASITSRPASSSGRLRDETALFEQVRRSVFKIETESGHGSGFLIDEGGLILTNQHVVEGQRYLAVKVSPTEKYPAAVLADDNECDLAVVRVHRDAVKGLEPLSVAREGTDIKAGQWVMTVGSPLVMDSFASTGIISRVQDDVVYSDVDINSGNSGGPLVSRAGDVLGVSTFRVSDDRSAGISGIVRIHLAEELVREARGKMNIDPPPLQRLPVEPDYEFPPDAIRDTPGMSHRDMKQFKLEAGVFDVHFFTPILIAGMEKYHRDEASKQRERRRAKGEVDAPDTWNPDAGLYQWAMSGDRYSPVVRIEAIPESAPTANPFKVARRYKDDFMKMRLLRGGREVLPITPGRVARMGGSTPTKWWRAADFEIEDVAYFGNYTYRPEAFAPGSSLTLEIYRESDAGNPTTIEVPAELVSRIGSHFKPFLDGLEQRPDR